MKKMAEWIGFTVSIDCGERGSFQGEIINATPTSISLTKAFCDGVPYENGDVTLSVLDILDLKLIEKQTKSNESSIITIAKPVAKRANRSYSTSESNPAQNKLQNIPVQTKSKPIDMQEQKGGGQQQTPVRKDNQKKEKQKYNKTWKDEACFGSPLDTMTKDFDFEKNLALFDKQAIYDEINSQQQQKPDVIKQADQNRRGNKYRHDENVIATIPALYRQIVVPKKEVQEYVTDDGLIVPSVSKNLRDKLFLAADKLGLKWEKRLELLGRGAAEICLQLLGGAHRLNPKNMHQFPTVVVLTGPHIQGAAGINTARQLCSHGVNTILYAVNCDLEAYKSELALYRLTKNKIITNISGLPHITDLIVLTIADSSNECEKTHGNVIEWTNNNRAPVLAIDPPVEGTQGVLTKYSLVPVLPLSHSSENGKIYLCNLGFPQQVFNEVGIKYRSPFGPKFVIPLHPHEEA